MKRRAFVFSVMSLAFGLSVPADARRRGGGIRWRGGSRSYGSGTLSPAVLKDCVIAEQKFAEIDEAMNRYAAAMDVRQTDLIRLEREINLLQYSVDQSDRSQVRRYNRLVDKFNDSIVEHNRIVSVAKPANEKIEKANEAYNRQCAGKQYYEDDMDKVKSELHLG